MKLPACIWWKLVMEMLQWQLECTWTLLVLQRRPSVMLNRMLITIRLSLPLLTRHKRKMPLTADNFSLW